MNLSFELDQLTAYLFVFARMAGALAVNPILARKNVPSRIRVALILGLTLVVAPGVNAEMLVGLNSFALVGALLMELFVGILTSFAFYMCYYMLFFAGDFLDVEFGLSMARVFDPGTSIQMSLTNNLLNILLILYFFVTDSHLLLVKLYASSYQIVPIGGAVITEALPGFFINLFSTSFNLVLRLTLPFVVAMFAAEIVMGVLMKLVSQINVFVISIQLKIFLGILLLFLFSIPICNFLNNYMDIMFTNMEGALYALVPQG